MLQSANEHVEKVDKGELDERGEDKDETDDDENIEGSGVRDLGGGIL